MSLKIIISILTLAVAVAISAFSTASVKDELASRIAPIGGLCMSGDSCAAAPIVVASGPRTGEEVYNTCSACHSSGAAGAPKFGDVAAWAPRIAQGAETLYTHSINGYNAMPAMGLCNDCSTDEIKAAVDHMVANSQ
ncbi:MAG: putative CxxxxCH...CXXCH cytochrome family protein [Pseudohongiellaceae bacterium]